MMKSPKPLTRLGWYRYYVARFNKTLSEAAEQLACWYLLLHLQHDAQDGELELT